MFISNGFVYVYMCWNKVLHIFVMFVSSDKSHIYLAKFSKSNPPALKFIVYCGDAIICLYLDDQVAFLKVKNKIFLTSYKIEAYMEARMKKGSISSGFNSGHIRNAYLLIIYSCARAYHLMYSPSS